MTLTPRPGLINIAIRSNRASFLERPRVTAKCDVVHPGSSVKVVRRKKYATHYINEAVKAMENTYLLVAVKLQNFLAKVFSDYSSFIIYSFTA